MTKLKTLKDLQYLYMREREDGEAEEGMCIDIEDLRAEAIKWIKELIKVKNEGDIKYNDDFYDYAGIMPYDDEITYEQVISWIKHFFNITDKDLE